MTELEQYKKAYATLAGRVDEAASRLLDYALKTRPQPDNTLRLLALELIFALHEAENIFLNEDPEEDEI